ncbi:MAG TPA: dienelactone hydrolase family protein [Gammaproteobacteria bacterium]|nr:dienelactone hydrolase family protein [Gammaproteobacteria bacterium]
MAITTTTVDYRDGATLLEGYLAAPSGKTPAPAVLIAHMWGGRVEFVCEQARQLAELGYTAFALDMYGKGPDGAILGRDPQDNARLMRPLVDNRRLLQQRILAAYKALRARPETDPGRIAAIGYCFGGLCALDLARTGAALRGVVSIHGLLEPPPQPERGHIKCKVLLLHGHDDPSADLPSLLALQQELTAMRADWQCVLYGHTQHAFTNPAANNPAAGTVYNETADRRSRQALLNFLEEILGS